MHEQGTFVSGSNRPYAAVEFGTSHANCSLQQYGAAIFILPFASTVTCVGRNIHTSSGRRKPRLCHRLECCTCPARVVGISVPGERIELVSLGSSFAEISFQAPVSLSYCQVLAGADGDNQQHSLLPPCGLDWGLDLNPGNASASAGVKLCMLSASGVREPPGAIACSLSRPPCGLGCGLVPNPIRCDVSGGHTPLDSFSLCARETVPDVFLHFPSVLLGLGCGLVPLPICHLKSSAHQAHLQFVQPLPGHHGVSGCTGCYHIPGPHKEVEIKNSCAIFPSILNPLCLPRFPYRKHGFASYVATRIGEAKNPGPSMGTDIVVAVINPTAIRNKAEIVSEVGAHVVLASETSATALTQQYMRTPFRKEGFACYWGPPVPEQVQTKSGQCLRGLSLGTAVYTRLPGRPSPRPFSPEQDASCRISECFVRFGCMEVRVVVVYGWPVSTPEAAARNNLLLAWAYERVTSSSLPAIIGGDFNVLPQQLPVWQSFAQQGWVEAGQFAQFAFGIDLPNTCKGSTRHDTFIIPPVLQQFVRGADVLNDAMLFDAHSPLRLRLHIPTILPVTMQWRLPKPFSDFQLSEQEVGREYARFQSVQQAFERVHDDQTAQALSTWSSAVEEAVSAALSHKARAEPQLHWPKALPRSFSGRCQQRERIPRFLPQLPRRARHGQPQPLSEATSVRSKHKLRQWRRLHVFQQGLCKLGSHRQGPHYTVLLGNLLKQWLAIKQAPGYENGFPQWVLSWPEFSCFPWKLPDQDFLFQLLQVVRFDYEAFAKQEKIKKDLFRYQVVVDAHSRAASPSFVRVRPPPPESLTRVQKTIQGTAKEVEVFTWHNRVYEVHAAASFLVHQPAFLAGVQVYMYHAAEGRVRLILPSDEDIVLPKSAVLEQDQVDCTPHGVAGSLTNFWAQFWTRDTEQEQWDLERWPHFNDILQGHTSPCPNVAVDMSDTGAWVHAARRLPRKKSTGVCGWHNSDLRVLPVRAITDVACILNSPNVQGFPPN